MGGGAGVEKLEAERPLPAASMLGKLRSLFLIKRVSSLTGKPPLI